ncbi:MAG: hypothetical protein HQM09_25190 [Candidatus Riflebacteria bacterium]|nr:hypothetical protein [Candidatus Riflebacteria bacterium]
MGTIEHLGYTWVVVLSITGLVLAQALFWSMTGRTFWRAMLPYEARRAILPKDEIRMDPLMVLEEWVALLFLGSCMTLPLIALNFIGFIHIFP